MGTETVFDAIKGFITKQRWEYDIPLLRETRLEKDLKITGDDAVEFIVAFGREFNVDVSQFMAADYFGPEGDVILPAILNFLTGRRRPRRKILTIGHLEKAVFAGKLDEDVIN